MSKFLKKTMLFFLILILSFSDLFSQTEFYPEKTIDLKIFSGKGSASSFFDKEGEVQTEIIYQANEEDQEVSYIYDFEEYSYGIQAEYALTDAAVLYTQIPLKYYTMQERKDTTIFFEDESQQTDRITVGEYTLFQPEYFSIGCRYLLYSKLAYAALDVRALIPPGFHDGLLNDPEYEFLSDGAFQLHSAVILGAKFTKGWLESNIAYRYRGEEYSNQLFIHTEFGLSTVPGSKLLAFLDFTQSFDSYDKIGDFTPKKTQLQEDIFDVGVLFQLFVTDNVYGEFSYKLNLLGKNTWNNGGFLVGLGVRL